MSSWYEQMVIVNGYDPYDDTDFDVDYWVDMAKEERWEREREEKLERERMQTDDV